jgi:uncharacterized SAM-binding protein YcdF (DUF218 family)
MKTLLPAALIFTLALTTGFGVVLGQDAKPKVRALPFPQGDPELVARLGGQGKVTKLNDAEAVGALLGPSAGRIIKAVDFGREAVALVSWTTSGPPEGMLRYEVKENGAEAKVVFFVSAPAARIRGQRARIAADFFAVPAGAKVLFEPGERPAPIP